MVNVLGLKLSMQMHPLITKSMVTALNDLNLDHLYVVYPQDVSYSLSDKISVHGLKSAVNVF